MMVQTADFGHLNDFASSRRLYPSRLRSILPQRQMSSPVMVIGAIRRKRATERSFAEDDDVVQTLAAIRRSGAQLWALRAFSWRRFCFHRSLSERSTTVRKQQGAISFKI